MNNETETETVRGVLFRISVLLAEIARAHGAKRLRRAPKKNNRANSRVTDQCPTQKAHAKPTRTTCKLPAPTTST